MNEKFIKIENLINKEFNNKNVNIIKLYWNIGFILNNDEFTYKEIVMLDRYLLSKYGIMVGFSRRNLLNIKKFYKLYCNSDLYEKLIKIEWYNHLWIMRSNYNEKNKIIDLCSKYILSVDDLKKITFSKSLPKMQIKQDLEHDEILREFKLLQQRFNNDK